VDAIDAELDEIWDQIKSLCDNHGENGVRSFWGEFVDVPGAMDLRKRYDALARANGKLPLGWASIKGGWGWAN